MAVLRYGISSSVELEFAEGVLSGEVGRPRGQPLADLAAATTAALAEPIDYPPLARSTTPADHVVLALDHGVPQVAQVTASIVDALVDSGIDPDGITVLRNQGRSGRRGRQSVPPGPGAVARTDHRLDPRSGRPPAVGLSGGQRRRAKRSSSTGRSTTPTLCLPVGCLRAGRNGRLLRHPRRRVSGVFRRENHPAVSQPSPR